MTRVSARITLSHVVSILAGRRLLKTLAGELAVKARVLIEADDDVTSRASQLGALGRAMLPASIDEASVYFRDGVEQMDAIGSGDNQFTNELLLFISNTKGGELKECEFHTLTNICELNLGGEAEKFPWGAFGHALSKTAGPRGLAKLSRWDDRRTIALSNTLLPYLTALVEDGKMDPKDAVALNRLARPVEYFSASTEEFSKAIRSRAGPNPEIMTELIQQFLDDNLDTAVDGTVETLVSLANESLRSSSDVARCIRVARGRYARISEVHNEVSNYYGPSHTRLSRRQTVAVRKNRASVRSIVKRTNPVDKTSLERAIDAFNDLQNGSELRNCFFSSLRKRVPFEDRARYVRNLSEVENLFFYQKLAELQECKNRWKESSAALGSVYRSLAVTLVQLHVYELVDDEIGRISAPNLKEIADFTDVSVADLVLELIHIFARFDYSPAGGVWLALAAFICPLADTEETQIALTRLLGSDATRLARNVSDGAWKKRLYPKAEVTAITSGLVWRMLGSPHAEDRWRAAHSIRSFARLGRWKVVDTLVRHIMEETAESFQASEVRFNYLHARLWLLIALARMAIDHQGEIARYKKELLSIVEESDNPHVLMRHFAARALLSCSDVGKLDLPASTIVRLRSADVSPHSHLKNITRTGGDFYQGRPASAPEPKCDFRLDYDFHKRDVNYLSRVFDRPCWKVADLMSSIVHEIDPSAPSMYSTGGRERPYRLTLNGIGTQYHTYGQQLGFHALFLAAGKLLETYPVINDYFGEDAWGEWFGGYTITRDDGLWLSDGTDKPPPDTAEPLLEKRKNSFAITGEKNKLLRLAGITSRVGRELIVEGTWFSADDVRVHIASALVSPKQAAMLARRLIREQPMNAWIPVFHETEANPTQMKEFTPWIVCPSSIARLDEHDPYGVSCANSRSHLASEYAASCSLVSGDPFNRTWFGKRGSLGMRAQAWGHESRNRRSEDTAPIGSRLFIRSSVLKTLLYDNDKDLLLLIKLERHEEKSYRGEGKRTHTVAAARISKTLDLEYFGGRINYPWKSRY